MLNENYAFLYFLAQLVQLNVGRLNQCTFDITHHRILAQTVLHEPTGIDRNKNKHPCQITDFLMSAHLYEINVHVLK